MTYFDHCFGPAPTISPSDAARALGEPSRRAHRAKVLAVADKLAADTRAGKIYPLGPSPLMRGRG